jgi:predicted O-methyltransferase YrrM
MPLTRLGALRRRCRTVLWFLRRPRLYPDLADQIARRLFTSQAPERTREQAIEWCAGRAQDSAAVIKRLTGTQVRQSLDETFPDIFQYAHAKENECGGTLGGPADLELLYHVAEHLGARRVVETGVGFGWSSLALLLSLQHRDNALLCSSDRPVHYADYDDFVGCVVRPDLTSKWRLFAWADKQALPKALAAAGTLDMCHYDSDKSYAGRMWAYPRLWAALRPGGVFVSDDVEDNFGFRDFAARVNREPLVIAKHGKYIGVLVKPA